MRPKVYSYVRFSDAKQASGASSERQQSYALRWAQEHGLPLDDELSMRDEGLSAYHQKHVKKGALGAFLQAVDNGRVAAESVLVVEGLDRLSRAEPIQAQAQLASIVNAGISVVTASDGKIYSRERLKSNPMDLVYSLLVMIRAHEESDTKSKRVSDAIRRQCKGWMEGTYRGLVRVGQTPSWLQVVDGAWRLIPDRSTALRWALDEFRRGMGLGPIAKALHERGLAISSAQPSSGHLSRLLKSPALKGEKHVGLDGETYVLQGYYPALLTAEEWGALQDLVGQRSRKYVRRSIPAILTGFGATTCGYCGAPLKSQTMTNRAKPDGSLSDGLRRLQCTRNNGGLACSVKGSCSAAPIERALMNFCSDLVNLQAFYEGDRAAGPRAELAAAKARLEKVNKQLARLTEALMDDDGAAPGTFVRKARELEDERSQVERQVQVSERSLVDAARTDMAANDGRWRCLAAGVEALDAEARQQARHLIADTFERIVIYGQGIRPTESHGWIDVVLVAKAGRTRMLRINHKGSWIAGEDVDLAAAD